MSLDVCRNLIACYESALRKLDADAEKILSMLSSATRAQKRRMFRELNVLACSYDYVENEISTLKSYAVSCGL